MVDLIQVSYQILLSTEDFHKFIDLKCVLKSIQYTRKSLGKWDFQRIGKKNWTN